MTEFLGNMYSWFTFIPKITLSNLFEILILTVLIYEVLLWVKSTRAGVLHRGGMIIVGFFLLGGMCIAFGCSAMLLELFISITFGTRMFVWSLYPVAVLSAIGLFWIAAGIIRPLGNAIRKRAFM